MVIASVATMTAEACKGALVESLEWYWVAPQVFTVEDLQIVGGQHMPHEQRVTATCHYTKDTGAESVRQQVEFYWDVWDERIYVDSPI